MTPTDCAYIAGFIDGEGCITLSKRMPSKGVNYSYRPEIVIANNHRETLEWIRERVGGAIHGPTKKGGYQLRLAAQATLEALTACRPYFVQKGTQADILLAFYSTSGAGRFIAREALYIALMSTHGGQGRRRVVWGQSPLCERSVS